MKSLRFKQIYLEITRKCNLKCPFCPSSSVSNNNEINNLFSNVQNFKKVYDKVYPYSDIFYFHVLGEPLLVDDLNLYLDYVRKINKENNLNKKVRITTNGINLNKKQDLIINCAEIDRINISVEAWYYLQEDLVDNLISNLAEFIKLKQIKRNTLTVAIRFWNDKNNPDIIKFNNYVKSKLSELLNLDFTTLHPTSYLLVSEASEFIWPDLKLAKRDHFSKCLGGIGQIAILLNGDVVLCCLDYLGSTKLGNIFEQTLEEILKSQVYLDWKNSYLNNKYYFELCQRCKYRN